MDKKVLATATVTATIVGVTATTTVHADEMTSTPSVETVTETTTTQATTVEQAQSNVDKAQEAVTTASNAAAAANQAATTAQLQKQVDDLTSTLNATQAKIQTLMDTMTSAKAQEEGLKKAVLETGQTLKQAVELKHQTACDLAQKQAELVIAQDVLTQFKAEEVKTAKGDQTQNGAANQEPELPIGVVPVEEKYEPKKPGTTPGHGYVSPAVTRPMASTPAPTRKMTPTQTGQKQLPETGSHDQIAYAMAGLALTGLGLVVKKKGEE